MELQSVLLSLGSGVLLPVAQELLNKYVPSKYRHLVALVASLGVGFGWTYVVGGGWEAVLANTAMIWATGQTVYAKLVKPKLR